MRNERAYLSPSRRCQCAVRRPLAGRRCHGRRPPPCAAPAPPSAPQSAPTRARRAQPARHAGGEAPLRARAASTDVRARRALRRLACAAPAPAWQGRKRRRRARTRRRPPARRARRGSTAHARRPRRSRRTPTRARAQTGPRRTARGSTGTLTRRAAGRPPPARGRGRGWGLSGRSRLEPARACAQAAWHDSPAACPDSAASSAPLTAWTHNCMGTGSDT